jgi:hypothetical protein
MKITRIHPSRLAGNRLKAFFFITLARTQYPPLFGLLALIIIVQVIINNPTSLYFIIRKRIIHICKHSKGLQDASSRGRR